MVGRADLERRLRQLAGDILVRTKEDARLEEALLDSDIAVSPTGSLRRELSIDSAARNILETASTERLQRFRRLVERADLERPPRFRVFRREAPIAAPVMDLAVPDWARGAAIEKTLGPFEGIDGRRYWFDFYPIAAFAPLYLAGETTPAALLPLSRTKAVARKERKVNVHELAAGSMWIRADLLSDGAPAGNYAGLKIDGGRLQFDQEPVTDGARLNLPAGSGFRLELHFAKPEKPGTGRHKTGADAATASMALPDSASFQITPKRKAAIQVGGATWKLYGQQIIFKAAEGTGADYIPEQRALLIRMEASEERFVVEKSRSTVTRLLGSAAIKGAGWLLPVAAVDLAHPTEASGTGGLALRTNSDLELTWPGLRDGPIALPAPLVIQFPGFVIIVDPAASNRYAHQYLKLWKDGDSAFRSELLLRYTDSFPLLYIASDSGNELLLAQTNAEGRFDRPVDVKGSPFPVHTLTSLVLLAFSDADNFAFLYDDNILVDALDPQQAWPVNPGQTISLAIRNALFTITPINGLFLFARLRDAETVDSGVLLLAFGLYGVLPTLPDPYAANLRWLRNQIRSGQRLGRPTILLVASVSWTKAAADEDPDTMVTGFAFAPLGNQDQAFAAWAAAGQEMATATPAAANTAATLGTTAGRSTSDFDRTLNEADWEQKFRRFFEEQFALLDVSSNADQMGVSFAWFNPKRLDVDDYVFYQVYQPSSQAHPDSGAYPLQVRDLDLSAEGRFVRGFALPQTSWEPLINLSAQILGGDPPPFFNFYPNDGGPTRLLNDSVELIPVAPIPVTEFLLKDFDARTDGFTGAIFTLPFGLKAFAEFSRKNQFAPGILPGAKLAFNRPEYQKGEIRGGLQLRCDAPRHPQESPVFKGGTLQLNNVVTATGAPTFAGTLGDSVGKIFNKEFFYDGITGYNTRGVPLTRIDFSGYGASTFSHWQNPNATIARTSQARFDIFVGRTAHEVIQVRSLIYPWGIRVVRTITIFRVSSSYVFRYDSGWQAESDGLYDFSYVAYGLPPNYDKINVPSPYEFHPGVVKGVFRVRNIVETTEVPVFQTVWNKSNGEPYIDNEGVLRTVGASTPSNERSPAVDLQPVFFDADVEIEGVVSGAAGGRVPSKRMLGYVQRAPSGEPLSPPLFAQLLNAQFGSLGGPVDCVVNIAESGQQMRLSRADVSASTDNAGKNIFVSAGRGSVVLPKDGSWSVVQHDQGSGEVSPLAATDTVPVIRRGRLVDATSQATDAALADLYRLANPRDLVRALDAGSRNFGLLQSTGTQKALFRLPRFEKGLDQLLGATPDFADAYRLVNSSAIFPNVADALPLNLGSFRTRILEQGYKLLDQADPDAIFEQVLPDGPLYLINEEFLKIYVEYAKKDKNGTKTSDGKLRFGFDAAATDTAKKWLSKVNDIGMVVDLGPLERLMIVKGKFDAEKGASPAFIEPELEFSDALKPVIDILQILLKLQGGDYKDALAKGLEIAMSNSADSWSYAFHAKKEIPLVRFPPGAAYDAPTNPLKLECRLAVGVYFNEVFDFSGSPGQLIPSAGAFLEFGGRLSVMCLSLAAATVYATGSVDLRTAADIKTGPSLYMKFGFGAEIVVGLPVVGNVSLLYMVGVEILLATDKLTISGFLLFRGRAEILGGIVTVTITIEAKGTVERLTAPERTNMIAQVTFGLDISIFLVINISFSESWQEARQIA